MSKYSKALSYYEKALKIFEKALPLNHPDLATCYSNMGATYDSMGDYSKALFYSAIVVEIYEKTLPPNIHFWLFPTTELVRYTTIWVRFGKHFHLLSVPLILDNIDYLQIIHSFKCM
jgi:tetratricopeptide (TPR) repeat protein